MARATNFLPVPVSPCIRIVERAAPTWAINSLSSNMIADPPTNGSKTNRDPTLALRFLFSSFSSHIRQSCAMKVSNRAVEKGFSRKSTAPHLMALTASSTLPWPVRMDTMIPGYRVLISLRSVRPSIPGIFKSTRAASILVWASMTSASSPFRAVWIW